MAEATDEIDLRLPAAEIDEILAAFRRSIAWQQLIMGKLLMQAQQAQASQPAPETVNGPRLPATSNRRARADA